jgi:hypothetical protein
MYQHRAHGKYGLTLCISIELMGSIDFPYESAHNSLEISICLMHQHWPYGQYRLALRIRIHLTEQVDLPYVTV